MKPFAFEYYQPANLKELLGLLNQFGDSAKLIAGGQSLAPMMNMRMANFEQLIDINQLSKLAYIEHIQDRIHLGAMTRHHEVAASEMIQQGCPLLSFAASTIGHYVIRQQGTLGGSLCHADPAAQMPLIALTLNASFHTQNIDRERTLTAADFYTGAMSTSLEKNEILKSISYPIFTKDTAWAFEMFNRRHGDYAIVSVALCVEFDSDFVIQKIRIGLNGVSDFAHDYSIFCDPFLKLPYSSIWLEDLIDHLQSVFQPFDDEKISASYRLDLSKTLMKKAFHRAINHYSSSRT
jgi:carbon-monoxide dehydrogenase medium subunit